VAGKRRELMRVAVALQTIVAVLPRGTPRGLVLPPVGGQSPRVAARPDCSRLYRDDTEFGKHRRPA
jgi:hypothetical protein